MFSFYSMQHAQPQAMIVIWMVTDSRPADFGVSAPLLQSAIRRPLAPAFAGARKRVT